ncbi:MAG: conjugal transfer protein TraF [Endomicrobium sp.]|jgi:hypothetical protein|nr:conjugal transfer protein TraF [Endomicrobium sp.]
MKRIFVLAFGFVFLAGNAFALVKDDRIMIKGIRPMGMGGAFTAVSDDENAVFYNPAGITQRTSWLLQILSINAATANETINVIKKASDIKGGSDGIKAKDIQKIKDDFSDKDISLSLSLPNLFFISSPLSLENNSISFGFGEFISADIGVNIGISVPDYVFQLALIAEKNPSLITESDIISVLPPDILKDLGSNLSIPQLASLLNRIENGDVSAITDLYNSFGDDEVKNLIADLKNGNKSLEDVISELESRFDASIINKILGSVGATGVVNTYVTGTFDVPLAYRFKSLSALQLPGELSVGVNLKYIYRVKASQIVSLSADDVGALENNLDSLNLAVLSGNGFGIDLGGIYHWTPEWNFGLQISDVFTRINYNNVIAKYPKSASDSSFTENAYIAPQFNIGVAYNPEKFYYWKDKYFQADKRFTFAIDLRDLFGTYEPDFADRFHIGIEYRLSPIALRAGLNKFHPTVGAGIELGGFQLIYAFYGDDSPLAKQLGSDKTIYYHEVQISIKFGHFDGRPFGKDAAPKSQPEGSAGADSKDLVLE